MNLQSKVKFGVLALAIAVMAVSAVPANAQQLYKATFNLPFEAQWGNTVMEPGEYTLTVEQAIGQKLIRLHGPAELAIFAGTSMAEAHGNNGRLTFVNVNGLYMLKSFTASAIGQFYEFPVHKAKGARAQLTSIAVASE
jgi:hypothetical protein